MRTEHSLPNTKKKKKLKERAYQIQARRALGDFRNLRGGAKMSAAMRGFGPIFCFLFLVGFVASQSYISDNALQAHASTGRFLLQAKTACTEDFENKNYTILTSQCKGPRYTAETCCTAFKEFACPIVDKINDEKTDCATTMFSYINLYGKYPPGLFANLCREGKEGLACPENATETASVKDQKSHAAAAAGVPVLMIVGGLIGSLFHFF